MNQSIVWPKKKKTEEKRKIEFQNKRKKEKKQKTPIPFDPGTQDGEKGLLHDLVKEKKKRRKKERKGRKKREIGRPTALDDLPIWVGQVVDFGWDRHIDYDG